MPVSSVSRRHFLTGSSANPIAGTAAGQGWAPGVGVSTSSVLPLYREVLSQFTVGAVTLTTGAGTQVGDQLVCIRMADSGGDSSPLTAPTGTAGTWTQRSTDVTTAGSAPRARVFTRTVATAGAQTVTCADTGRGNDVVLYVLPAGRSVNDVQLSSGTTASASRTCPSVTATGDAALICFGSEYNAPSVTSYGALTQDATGVANDGTAWAASQRVSSGSTGTRPITLSFSTSPWLTGSIAASLGAAPIPLTLQPMQPATLMWDETTYTNLYSQPGALVSAGRANYNDADFHTLSAAGATVLLYIESIVNLTFGRYHTLLHASSVYGPAVPNWPGDYVATSTTITGYLADFRVGSILLDKLPQVLELAVQENPHIGGFFADDLGTRSYYPGVDWDSWTTTAKDQYRAGAIAVAQVFRNVCNNHGLIFLANGPWAAGSVYSAGGGYPDPSVYGCSLADGGVVEGHDSDDIAGFWTDYANGAQWATASPITNGNQVMLTIGPDDVKRPTWAATGAYAYRINQAQPAGYDPPSPPWGSFHPTGLPSQVAY